MQNFRNYMQKASQWDQFPAGNFCETFHPIKRSSFIFEYNKIQLWRGGECITEESGKSSLDANVDGDTLNITMNDPRLREWIVPKFCFKQISENGDRIVWSKDIFNTTGEVYQNDPAMMSLFYKEGKIARVYLHVDSPKVLIELN